MPISTIIIEFNCQKCNGHFEFEDKLENSGIRPERCNNFDLKFIKGIEENEVAYTISFKCKKCKKEDMIASNFEKDKKHDDPITKKYNCCGAQVIINIYLLFESNEENDREKEKNKKDTTIIQTNIIFDNRNNNFNNNYNPNENNKFNNNLNNINYNNQIMNNNIMNMNNNFHMMNNGFNMINNNQFMARSGGHMNMQFMNNMIGFRNNNNNKINNNIMQISNPQMNNLNNMMNNLNINNNNSIRLKFQFQGFGGKIFTKEIPFNKTIKEALNELGRENPDIKKFCENVRNDIVLCDGENINYTQTIEEIKEEGYPLEDNCIILIPNVVTVNKL